MAEELYWISLHCTGVPTDMTTECIYRSMILPNSIDGDVVMTYLPPADSHATVVEP